MIYLVSFLGSVAVLPGNIISALFMEKIGRVKIIGDSRFFLTFLTNISKNCLNYSEPQTQRGSRIMLNTQHLKFNICESVLVCYGCDSVNGKAKLHISHCTVDFKREAHV